MIGAGVLLTALAVLGAPGLARGKAPVAGESEAGGLHYRLETAQGPVHVWTPAGYNRHTAGIVFYVHGFYIHIDEAWKEHELARQFADSGRNALFIAPEAPGDGIEQPVWTDLQALVTAVAVGIGQRAPNGPWVAVGHSGAYRVLVEWLDEPQLHHLVLIDALYGNEQDFRRWLEEDPRHQMTMAVKGTNKWADPFVNASPYAVTLPAIPDDVDALSRHERRAKLLCLQSQYGHFELITWKRTLPVLLRRTGVAALPGFVPPPLPDPPPTPPAPKPVAGGRTDAGATPVPAVVARRAGSVSY
jgi:hypothetical protein